MKGQIKMFKKALLGALCAVSIFSVSSALAEYEEAGAILVNDRIYISEEYKPILVNDRTLVDHSRLFNYAGLNSKFYPEENKVIIDSIDNKKRLALYVDSPVIELYTYTTIFSAEKTEITLDVAPILVDGKIVMCPLRGVLEAFGYEVNWDAELNLASFRTIEPGDPATTPTMSLSTDAVDVSAGDTVDMYITLTNMESLKGYELMSFAGCIKYDKSEFELVSYEILEGRNDLVELEVTNPDYAGYGARTLTLIKNLLLSGEDVQCLKMTFKSLTDNGGTFSLANGVQSKRSSDNNIIVRNETVSAMLARTDVFAIDLTPVVVK